jgi:hypothetical protein
MRRRLAGVKQSASCRIEINAANAFLVQQPSQVHIGPTDERLSRRAGFGRAQKPQYVDAGIKERQGWHH